MVFQFIMIGNDKSMHLSLTETGNNYVFFFLLSFSYLPSSLILFFPQAIPIETAKQNPNVALVLTSYGGHIGFLEGLWPRQSTYMDRVFKQFVQAMVEHGHELSSM